LRKVNVAINHNRREVVRKKSKQYAADTTMTALTSLGESGVALKFSRSALSCRTLPALAERTIESMGFLGLDCHVQLRTAANTLSMTVRGAASPLETSVLDKSAGMDRIFGFGNRLVLNYDSVTLLVINMPLSDPELCGRIRDHAAMIAESADLAVGNISLRTDAIKNAQDLRYLASGGGRDVEALRNNYRELQLATRLELDNMAHVIESMYIHLGLTNSQEFTISDVVRSSVERVLTLFDQSSALDRNFARIVEGLTTAAQYSVAEEEEARPLIELW